MNLLVGVTSNSAKLSQGAVQHVMYDIILCHPIGALEENCYFARIPLLLTEERIAYTRMLRSIVGAVAPTVRRAAPAALLLSSAPRYTVPRFFGTTTRRDNDREGPSTSASDSQGSQDQQATPPPETLSSSPDVELVDETNAPIADEGQTQSAPAPTASLDDILGAASAVALPGSESDSTERSRDFRRTTLRSDRYNPVTRASSASAHKMHVRASRNNTIITLTAPDGNILASSSGGSVGFKHTQRSGYEAGYRAAFAVFDKITKFRDAWQIKHLEIFWNGFGQGREAVFRAILSDNGRSTKELVSKMSDTTPIKIGGVRPKKRRML